MRLTHAVADQEDDVSSDGPIPNSGERQTGHGCLSSAMRSGARNWPRRGVGGASIGTHSSSLASIGPTDRAVEFPKPGRGRSSEARDDLKTRRSASYGWYIRLV